MLLALKFKVNSRIFVCRWDNRHQPMRKAKTDGKALSVKSQAHPLDSQQELIPVVLTERKLDKLLNVSKGKAKVKSVSTPFAQYAIECEATTARGWDAESLSSRFKQIQNYDKKVAVIFDLQFAGGCRISEILSVNFSDIDSLGKVTVNSQKGGNTRIVQSSFSASFLSECKEKKVNPFYGIDRFYVYRVYKRFGVSEYYGDNKRASVTHLPRHEVALASKAINRAETVTKEQLGQKSVKSTAHYTGKGRGKRTK